MEHNTQPGLVICDITARSKPQPTLAFVTPEELTSAASQFPPIGENTDPVRYALELSPGSVRITRRSTVESRTKGANYQPRRRIHEWSDKSRANMVARLCTLDYRPLFATPETMPALITLTYPGDWRTVVPDGAAAKKHLKAFRRRYERRWGIPLRAIWKMEFQRRGACHFHLFSNIPLDQSFPEWLSESWADVVGHPDPRERAKHVLAGTGLDYDTAWRASDAKRVAVYFTKHNSPNKGAKEYQNQPPEEWLSNQTVGRYWGYWNLDPLTVSVQITDADALKMSRFMRRWSRANAPHQRRQVVRTCQRTGKRRCRWVTRRGRPRLTGRLGFLSVNDGPETANLLARLVRQDVGSRH